MWAIVWGGFTGHVSFLMCSIPVISEDDAREALLEFIGQRCCYGKKAAREFVFANIDPSSAFHVRLVVSRHYMYMMYVVTLYICSASPCDAVQLPDNLAPGRRL